jgi:CRP/FNR family transcriptional regulator, cyclic AMP receptor protein
VSGEPVLDKVAALRRSSLFDLLSAIELEVLGDLSKPRRFAPGELIFAEGDLGDSLFVLVAGEVEVTRHEREGAALAVLGAPAVFGEMSLVDREQRSATVRARTPVTALQLTAENFASFRKHSRDGFTLVVINIARLLSSRLRETSAKLASRL